MHVSRWIVLLAIALAPLASRAEGDGLATGADRDPWARFQGRIAYTGITPPAPAPWRAPLTSSDGTGLQVNGVSVMGDVYFGAAPAGLGRTSAGGFRATSGVIVGSRSSLWGMSAMAPSGGLLNVDRRLFGSPATAPAYGGEATAETSGTLPYIGIGYSALAPRAGWSFSADLGLVSYAPGNAVRLGRVVGGSQNLDDVVRDMRLAPVFQLGASYSF